MKASERESWGVMSSSELCERNLSAGVWVSSDEDGVLSLASLSVAFFGDSWVVVGIGCMCCASVLADCLFVFSSIVLLRIQLLCSVDAACRMLYLRFGFRFGIDGGDIYLGTVEPR